MITTIKDILIHQNVSLQGTIYSDECAEVLDFPLTVGNFFALCSNVESGNDFKRISLMNQEIERQKQTSEYQQLFLQIEQLRALLKSEKQIYTDTQKLSLRQQLKQYQQQLSDLEEQYSAKVRSSQNTELRFLQYKGQFNCCSMKDVSFFIPAFEHLPIPEFYRMPLFVRNLPALAHAAAQQGQLGIVGGPCLFGCHEVIIRLKCTDGETAEFDFSVGREQEGETPLEHYFKENGSRISEIHPISYKKQLTHQECLDLQYPFEFAQAVSAKLVIPLPDLSYVKYLQQIMAQVAPSVREKAVAEFRTCIYAICDIYLNAIEVLQKSYPDVLCRVLHERDESMLSLFYEKRKPYVEKIRSVKRLTAYEQKFDSVIDYITMLALPYYIFGTKHVLQIDSIYEADSMRRCMKIHKGDVEFSSILFSEYLSADRIHTVFEAPLAYKDYTKIGD